MPTQKPAERMYVSEVQTAFLVQSGVQYRWKKVRVELTANTDHVRCVYCSGRVKFFRQRKVDGPADHVRHLVRRDSEGCMGGSYFQGTHRRSDNPVE